LPGPLSPRDGDRVAALGAALFAALDASPTSGDDSRADEERLRYLLCRSVIAGASGLTFEADDVALASPALGAVAKELAELDPLLRLGHASTWPPSVIERDALRRDGVAMTLIRGADRLAIVLTNEGTEARRIDVAAPIGVKELAVAGETIRADGGRIALQLAGASGRILLAPVEP
jgi:hypothetical protein